MRIKDIKISTTMIGILLILISFMGCNQKEKVAKNTESEAIFSKGVLAPKDHFTGNVWVTGLVKNDSIYTTAVGSVTFEPGARTHWHSHPAGQILLVTSGRGYHQIEGQPKEIIKKGDVVICPPGVNHWHGATENSSMTHIYIVPNTEKGIVKWGRPVTDEEYHSTN